MSGRRDNFMTGYAMHPINIISMVLIIASIYFEIRLASACKEKLLIGIPVVLWLLNSLLFYFFVPMDVDFIMEWSRALRLHGYAVILMLSIYRYEKFIRGRGG